MEQHSNVVEYITKWPPEEYQPPPEKKPRQHETETGADRNRKHVNKREGGLGNVEGGLELQGSCLEPRELDLVQCDITLHADVLLARWWKLKQGSLGPEECIQIPRQCNPTTSLYHIARLLQARAFLCHRVCHLQKTLSTLSEDTENDISHLSDVHVSLASCFHRLGDYQQALRHAEKGMVSDGAEKKNHASWICELLRRQIVVVEKQSKASEILGDVRHPPSVPNPIQVERRSEKDFSFKEFFQSYALTHTPVIITGLVEEMTTQPWTLDHITKVIGHMTAPLKQMVAGSVEWARLEPAGECRVEEFVKSLDDAAAAADSGNSKYLFDWSLPLHCPQLVEELTIPKYFASDFLQRTPTGSLYRDSWPSLFVAPAGVTSELHVDAFGSNFWMALFQGRKRWVFFPPEDTPLLYPIYSHSTDAVFEANLGQPDLEKHPLLALTHPRECILEPGEVLFVPAGCPHRVENLEKSLAISANFVDSSNFEVVCKELRVNGLLDVRSVELLKCFETERFCTELDEAQDNLTWQDFKTWPRNITERLDSDTHRH